MMLALVLLGVFDPQAERVVWQRDYRDGLACLNEHGPLVTGQSGTVLLLLPTSEAVNVRWGDRFELTLSPVGFVSLAGGEEVVRPLAPFPHVRLHPTIEGNEVWIDVVDGAAVGIRINRELYWVGDIPLDDDILSVECVS